MGGTTKMITNKKLRTTYMAKETKPKSNGGSIKDVQGNRGSLVSPTSKRVRTYFITAQERDIRNELVK